MDTQDQWPGRSVRSPGLGDHKREEQKEQAWEEKKMVVNSRRKDQRQDIGHRTLFHGDGYQSMFMPIVRIKMPVFI